MKIKNPRVLLGGGFAKTDLPIDGKMKSFMGQWSIAILSEDGNEHCLHCSVPGEVGTFSQINATNHWYRNKYVLDFNNVERLIDIKSDPELAAEIKSILEKVVQGLIQVEGMHGRTPDQEELGEVFGQLLPRWDRVVEHSEHGITEGRLVERNFGEDLPKIPRA